MSGSHAFVPDFADRTSVHQAARTGETLRGGTLRLGLFPLFCSIATLLTGRVLAAPIRVSYKPLARKTTGQGHIQRVDDQPVVDPLTHRATDDLLGVQVFHRRQEPTLTGCILAPSVYWPSSFDVT
jgi:hypothetical protein